MDSITYAYVNRLLRNEFKKHSDIYALTLDYGCGAMPYKSFFPCYVGADINGSPDVLIKENQPLPFTNGAFDIIISSQVLEHVKDTGFYLAECKRLLKPGGRLLLSTHGTWQYHTDSDYYRWTRQGLEYILKDFKVLNVTPILGQLALSTQLKLSFYDSFFTRYKLQLLFYPFALLGQLRMFIEDLITPGRVKQRDSAIYMFTLTI